MKTYLFFAYREWAINIYQWLSNNGDSWKLITVDKFCNKEIIDDIKPDIIFFVGWSWVVPKEITDAYPCLCLHPSPLPKYRGGSPIQNQIINGETDSAATIFKMGDEMDAGDIIKQSPLSLDGYLDDILNRIEAVGRNLLYEIIEDYTWDAVQGKVQDDSVATWYPRRRPEYSELRPIDLTEFSAKQIYDMVRCLQPPYPEVFINCKEGKLILEKVRYEL